MASSSKPKTIYDVFLSFRGTDLRNNFVGHLYQALVQSGIDTFWDNEELRKGGQIFPALMKAIEESCTAIIIFSENYASSRWCLAELAKIMERKEQRHLNVLPVFYKVDPREVRTGRESYARALDKHKNKHGEEKVKRWKKALFEAGSLSGWTLNDEDESKLIQKIVKKISVHLGRTPLRVAKHPVGLEPRVVKLKGMLKLESNDDVVMVGLWGKGGIGKTTLAKALFNSIERKFEGACFLANVREASKDGRGLVTLQEKILIDTLLLQKELKVSNVDEGINLIRRRLSRKKVLLILDDVDALHQLDALVGEGEWFGNGSRIIVTTRDKQLLNCLRIDQDQVYEVEALDNNQAHELLSKHAFQMHQIRTDLVDSALNYAKGLPLALEVLGSLLCGKSEAIWKSTIKKLSRYPSKDINNVLKVSFDGLEENEKEIFLHIACFFKGWAREYTKKVLDSCDLEAVAGFDILIDRSLISIEGGILKMHDLIQAMGKDIVNQECSDDPQRRSRLWLYDDVINVLSCDMGDFAVKAIVLALPEPKEMCVHPDAFTKLRRLRLLILHNVHDSLQGPRCLPNELRWFEWTGRAGQIPKFSSPKKLVGLNLSKGNITGVPKQFKDFQNLTYINFNQCKLMVRTPDLSCTPNLEELNFGGCEKLVEAHESIAYLDKLQVLDFGGCSELSVFPNVLNSKNLRELNFTRTKFEKFPDIPHELKGFKDLDLDNTAIKELPTSIENLVALKNMRISNCENLKHLPSSIYKLQNLENLQVFMCPNLIGFPKYEDSADPCMEVGLPNLRTLELWGCNLSEAEFLENLSYFPLLSKLNLVENNITTLPSSISKRDSLSRLYVSDCHQLQEIPEFPPFLTRFFAENCKFPQKNEDLIPIHHIVRACPGVSMETFEHPPYFLFPQGEMPQWVFPIEGGSIFFMISKDLHDKILGLAVCTVLNNDEKLKDDKYWIEPYVDGKWEADYRDRRYDFYDGDHIAIEYTSPYMFWGEVDFAQIDGRYIQYGVRVEGRVVKKWGFRIICEQLGDDLKAEFRDNQLINPALLYEIDRGSTHSIAESSHVHEDYSSEADLQEDWQDCQASTEEHTLIGSKRKHEFNLPLGKRIRTMLTSMLDRWRGAR